MCRWCSATSASVGVPEIQGPGGPVRLSPLTAEDRSRWLAEHCPEALDLDERSIGLVWDQARSLYTEYESAFRGLNPDFLIFLDKRGCHGCRRCLSEEAFRRELDAETSPSRLRELALELYDLWQRQRTVTTQLVLQDIRKS